MGNASRKHWTNNKSADLDCFFPNWISPEQLPRKKPYRVQQACSFIIPLLVIREDRYTEQTHSVISVISLTKQESFILIFIQQHSLFISLKHEQNLKWIHRRIAVPIHVICSVWLLCCCSLSSNHSLCGTLHTAFSQQTCSSSYLARMLLLLHTSLKKNRSKFITADTK